jgi:putative phage-type endonuclease
MITEFQRHNRKKYLGSSDAAKVAGVDPWSTPYDLWLEKTGQVEDKDIQGDAIEVGNYCEDAVLRWFAEKRDLKVIRNQFRVHNNGIMAANMDAIVQNDPTQAIEVKTTGVTSRFVSEEWGEVGTDQVPERIALQCYHQMAVLPELKVIWVPVLIGGVGFRHYAIERNDEIITQLEILEKQFWNENVLAKVAPKDSAASLDFMKRLKREPGSKVFLQDDVLQKWQRAKEAVSCAEKEKKEAEAELLRALGDAECGESSFGSVTYMLTERKGYTVEPTSFRQLRFKKQK